MKNFLKRIRLSFQMKILSWASLSAFSSSLYYVLFSRAFGREQQSVIKGRLKYHLQNEVHKEANYLLRRNIHRLEKGLIMKNRRPVFAMDYIEETVNAYVKVVKSEMVGASEKNLKWYGDVLTRYFDVVDISDLKLKELKSYLQEHIKVSSQVSSVPYQRDFSLRKVKYDDFLDLAKLRRAVRWYEDRSVPRELVDKAISVAALSPSACNRQPFEFRIYDDKDLVQKVATISWGTLGFSQNFPAIVVIIGKLEAYFDERDRHVIYIDGSLAAMSFMFALETLGLSSCPINWPDIDDFELQMSSLLNLEKNERPIMLISFGYPDKKGLVPFSEKKEVVELRNYNKIKT